MNRRRAVASLSATLLVTGCMAAGAAPDEAGLRAADAEQMRIIVQEDAAAQNAFMHANYMVNGPSNQVKRKAVLVDMLAHGGMASDRFERTIEDLQITGNVGIVMGRETVTPAQGSQLAGLFEGTLQRRFTNVFLFEDGHWRFLARQASVIASPPGAR